jgi:cytochrome c-type biogenesis protein CcmH/NrfG
MGAAWVVLGQALKAAERMEEAERAYAEAIRLDGMDALARMGLGELKIAAGRPREAIREFELALAAAADAGGGAFGIGECAGAGGTE